MSNHREKFINWAKHLDSDGYFGALTTFDDIIAPMLESLTEIDANWCPHPGIRVNEIKDMRRDFCGACSTWIYKNEINSAKMALNAFEEKLKNE